MAKVKELTIFEAFVYFDVNNQNMISNMELRLGLQNLEISLEKYELDNLWNVFEKNSDNKVNFNSFFRAFVNANCFQIIKFDDKVKKLLKRFVFLLTKHGNCEELFRKFDIDLTGYISLDKFKYGCEHFRLGLNEDEMVLIFKSICTPSTFNPKLKVTQTEEKSTHRNPMTNTDSQSISESREEKKPYRYFSYKKFVQTVTFFRKKDKYIKILFKFDNLVKEKGLTYKQILKKHKGSSKDEKRDNRRGMFNKKKKRLGIYLKDLKSLLKSLNLGLSVDEINQIIDSFDDEYISLAKLEHKTAQSVQIYSRENNKKKTIFNTVVNEMQEVLLKEHV